MSSLLGNALAIPDDDPLTRISISDCYQFATGLSATTHKQSGRYIVRCPVADHEDVHPSCSLNPTNDSWKCFACGKKGGKLALIIEAGHAKNRGDAMEWLKRAAGKGSRLSFRSQPAMKINQTRGEAEQLKNEVLDGTFPYTDEKDRLLYQVQRYWGDPAEEGGRDKRFIQRAPRPEGGWKYNLTGIRRVPYKLSKVRKAAEAGRSIIVIEGEIHVEFLEYLGFNATTNAGGVTYEWPVSWAKYFEGSPIIFFLHDADKEGRAAMQKRAKLIQNGTEVVHVDFFPDRSNGEDIFNWAIGEKLIRDFKDRKIPRPLAQHWERILLVPKAVARKRIEAKLSGYYKTQRKQSA